MNVHVTGTTTRRRRSRSKRWLKLVLVVTACVVVAAIGGGIRILQILDARDLAEIQRINTENETRGREGRTLRAVSDSDVVQAFTDGLADGRLEGAYLCTTSKFHDQYSFGEFQTLLSAHQLLLKPRGASHKRIVEGTSDWDNQSRVLQVTVQELNQKDTYTLRLVREGDRWKVDRITFR
jgi:hypothetical protein